MVVNIDIVRGISKEDFMTEIKISKKEEKQLFFKALLGSPFFTIVASVLTTFLVGMVFAKVGGGVPISVTQTTTETKSTFDVEGVGEAVAIPDEATLSFGVEETASKVEVATSKVNETMNSFQEKLNDLGVDKKDIQTSSYSVFPDYDYLQGRSTVNGYRVSSRVEVAFKDFEMINQAIGEASNLGLNQVGQLSFGLSDEAEEEVLSEAREKAVESAKSKAKELAKLAGINLGNVINVTEQRQGNFEPRPMYEVMDKAVGGEDEEMSQPQVQPGSEKARVTVTLSYATE